VVITLTGGALDAHLSKAGTYLKMDGTTQMGYPVYQQSGGGHYLYVPLSRIWWAPYYQEWRVSSSFLFKPELEKRDWLESSMLSQCPEDTGVWTYTAITTYFGIDVSSSQRGISVGCPSPPPPPAPLTPPHPFSSASSSASAALETGVIVAIGTSSFFVIAIGIAASCVLLARRRKRAGIPKIATRQGARNAPGAWHFMISYTQRSDRAVALATKLKEDLAHRGYSVWLDVDMADKSEAAMNEAVENSMVFLAIITGGSPNIDDDNAYLKRDYCLSELRWAFAANKHVQPVVHMDDKPNIGSFVAMAPDDLNRIGSIDFVDLNTSHKAYFGTGIELIFEKAGSALAVSGASARRSHRSSSSVAPMNPDVAPVPKK